MAGQLLFDIWVGSVGYGLGWVRSVIWWVVVVVLVVVDLYSASRRASNALNVPLRRKRWVFSADFKPSVLRAGSRSERGSEFHSIGPVTEKARRPNVLRRCGGIINWWRLAGLGRWK